MGKGAADNKDPKAVIDKLYDNLKAAGGMEFPDEVPPLDNIPEKDVKLCHYQLNDQGNAQRLIKRYGQNLLYVNQAGWYAWTGKKWSLDDGDHEAQKSAHKTQRALKGEALAKLAVGNFPTETPTEFRDRVKKFYGFTTQSGNSNKLSAMVREAEPYLTIPSHAFDTPEFLVNLENGTLNLRAQQSLDDEHFDGVVLEKHNRKNKITKQMEVGYDASLECPNFLRFLNDIQPDQDIQLFLQRFFGYCLTGSIKEQIILMFHGGGANGKSTLMKLMSRMMGDYALNLPFASILNDPKGGGGANASPDLARLPGARFVTAAEPDVGAQFSESVLKEITGGEAMTVRHLYKDFFEFTPQFKLCLSFNNKPQIRGQDDGIWRRVCLVPFEQQFMSKEKLKDHPGAKERVDGVDEVLWAERGGIFNWMLDGYRMWSENGLQIPDVIRAATTDYREESNPIGDFIRAMIKRNGSSTRASEVYEAYTYWCRENASKVWSQTAFGRKLSDLGYKKDRVGGFVYYSGMVLTDEAKDILDRNRPQPKFSGDHADD